MRNETFSKGQLPLLNFSIGPNYNEILATKRNADAHSEAEVEGDADAGQGSVKVAIIFASKAIVQIIVNLFVGPLTNKIGYR